MSNVITARIDDQTFAGLTRLGEYSDRSRAWLVAEAVRRYVQQESEFFEFLQEGEDAIDQGDFVTHEQLATELEALKKAKRAA